MGDGITTVDLGGVWEFAPRARLRGKRLPEPRAPWAAIVVPGAWEAQSFGLDTAGPVLYRRSFRLPADWPSAPDNAASTLLCCEAISYACAVWLDGHFVGAHEGMWDAFELPLGTLAPGSAHELLIAVERQQAGPGGQYPLRETPVGFLPDLGVLFGGIWQPIRLQARGTLALDGLRVQARLADDKLLVWLGLENVSTTACQAELRWRLGARGVTLAEAGMALRIEPGTQSTQIVLPRDGLALWSVEQPTRYELALEISAEGRLSDRLTRQIGLRELRVAGERLLLNGQPLFLRGILDWGWDEQRLCPTPSDDELRAELGQLKGLGFNLVKHCLYVPPRRTLELADELGMLAWIELPLWLPKISAALRERLRQQYPRIARQRAGHASLLLWTLGCELNASVDGPLLADLYRAVRDELPGEPASGTQALLRDNSGSGECYGGLAQDSADFYDYHFYCDPPFLPHLIDAFAAGYRPRRPWLFGEFNDSDTWRSLAALAPQPVPAHDAGASALAPRWWLARDWSDCPHIQQPVLPLAQQAATLAAQGLPADPAWHEGLRLRSNRHAELLRKLTIERVRQYPAVTGYVVTVLRDQPISTAGLFDDLGRLKVDAAAFRRFNADAVLTLSWDLRRTWLAGGDRLLRRDAWSHFGGQPIRAHVVLSNFGTAPLGGWLRWRLWGADGALLGQGRVACHAPLATGEVQEVAMIELLAPTGTTARRVELEVELEGTDVANRWALWVYPPIRWQQALAWLGTYGPGELTAQLARLCMGILQGAAALEAGRVVVATSWDERLEAWVGHGGRALLLVPADDESLPSVKAPFWREALKEVRPHAAWGDFVQDSFGGLQFYALSSDNALDRAVWANWRGGTGYTPLLRRIDARHYGVLDYLAELRLGAGCLLITTLRLQGGLGDTPSGLAQSVSGQALLWRLVSYLRDRVQ
jgi:hypothetical protein